MSICEVLSCDKSSMEAFAAMDDLFGAATKQQQRTQQQHFSNNKINPSPLELIDKNTAFDGRQILQGYSGGEVEEVVEVRNELLQERHIHQQQQEQQQPQHEQQQNLQLQQQQQLQTAQGGCLSPTNGIINGLTAADQTDSKEACKDAGSWSTHATAVLLDVFKEKRVAINGRNFRGEEWEELASGVNERCNNAFAAATSSSGPSTPKEQWKNAKQCSYKMSNLKRKYKSEKEMMQLSGPSAVSSWQWFPKMEAIFAMDPKYASLGGGGGNQAKNGDLFDEENANHVTHNNANQGLPASKSASTNNIEGCSPSESSPRSLSGELHVKKKQCLGAANMSTSEFIPPASFQDSMKLMLVQQKETLQLLRELVSFKSQHRHEQDSAAAEMLGNRRDVLELKMKLETTDRELMHLKFVYETKERDLREAMVAYEEKCRMKSDLLRKLMEARSSCRK